MKKNIAKHILLSLLALFVLLSGLFPKGTAAIEPPEETKKSQMENNFPALELPVPQSDQDKMYLGLEGTGSFKLNQIKTRILIIEIFNFYCPHCQQAAPRVNALYRDIQQQPEISNKIKIIGIGFGNSTYEINLFKQKYEVPFPLFPDQDTDIATTCAVRATPTFIGVKLNDQGRLEKFFFQEGEFDEAPDFLKKVMEKSGLKQEE